MKINKFTQANTSCCGEEPKNDDKSSCGCGTADYSKETCPSCGGNGVAVSKKTFKSHLKKELYSDIKNEPESFHFCDNPKCDTVYYSNSGDEKYSQKDVRQKINIKNNDLDTPLCYCKKLLKQDVLEMIERKEENIPSKIKAIISEGVSFCEKSNPRGTCCTEAIAMFLKEYDLDWKDSSN